MDKFGVFNLLNSFMKVLGNQNNNLSNNENKKSNTFLENNSGGISDFINGVLSKKEEVKPNNLSTPTRPLQSGMIHTMNNHDEFIKRVMKNNGKS